jgi:hypothetical protein
MWRHVGWNLTDVSAWHIAKQVKEWISAYYILNAGFLPASFFDPENGGYMLILTIG